MACLLFTEQIGAKPTLVAYRGSGPALNDLIGSHVDMYFPGFPAAIFDAGGLYQGGEGKWSAAKK